MKSKVKTSTGILAETISDFSENSGDYVDSFWDKVNDFQIHMATTDEEKENIFVKKSLMYLASKNYDFVEKYSQECLKLNPKNYVAHYLLSIALSSHGNSLESLEHAKLALEYHEIVIPYECSREYEKMTRPKESSKMDHFVNSGKRKMHKISNFFKGNSDEVKIYQRIAEKIHITQLIGMSLIQNEFYSEGITHFENMISDFKEFEGMYLYMIGVCYYHLHDNKKAFEHYKLAMDKGHNPNRCEMMMFMTKKNSFEDVSTIMEEKLKIEKKYKIKIPDCHLTLLSYDLVNYVISFCDYNSLVKLGETNQMFHRHMSKPEVWSERIINYRFNDYKAWNIFNKLTIKKQLNLMFKHPILQYSSVILQVQNDLTYDFSKVPLYEDRISDPVNDSVRHFLLKSAENHKNGKLLNFYSLIYYFIVPLSKHESFQIFLDLHKISKEKSNPERLPELIIDPNDLLKYFG
jgi:tetratricopeptide (TPR) repeat protein